LRKWYGHDPEKWAEFKRRYLKELDSPEKIKILKSIAETASGSSVTILYSSAETRYNDATVIEELLKKLMGDKSKK